MTFWPGDEKGLPQVDPSIGVEMPPSGIWYQPRSLWSASYMRPLLSAGKVTLPRRHFQNGTRWPITLERLALSPVNYSIELGGDPVFEGHSPYGFAYSVLQGVKVRLSAPFRKSFSRQEIQVGSHPALPTGQPLGPRAYQSSLFGLNYLQFDKPLYVPRYSACSLGLGGLMAARYSTNGILINFQEGIIRASMFFNEAGGLFSGHQRFQWGQTLPASAEFGESAAKVDPYDLYPYPMPLSYVDEDPPTEPFSNWPPSFQMQGRTFEKQEANRSGSAYVYGMGVMLDQIDYDELAGSSAEVAGVDLDGGGFKISPLSTRIGARSRMTHGINTDEWWRPGAPLALVLDTITPALVYDLPEPILLGPGDSMLLEIESAGTDYFGVPFQVAQTQLGVSLNGYTMIEG